MNSDLEGLIHRLETAEQEHQQRLDSDARATKTNWWIRRQYLAHRSFSHANDERQAADGALVGERAWLAWTTLRWKIEIALARMRDKQDRELLQNRNRSKFGSPAVPPIQWLMGQAQAQGADEAAQYENVLRWVLRPDLYSYRWREFGGEEFKRLSCDRKDDLQLLRRKVVYESTGDPEYPLRAEEAGTVWRIRINEFPDEPLFTLLIGEKEVIDFDNWPGRWKRSNTWEQGTDETVP
jgi:hypothetical protein